MQKILKIKEFHEEFMDKINEFSLSWRKEAMILNK
jgi:hypothetical protein